MGYYTEFTIEKATEEQSEALKKESGYSWCEDTVRDVKWYSWKDDLQYVSRQFPATAIVLTGVGEEHPDLWEATALGGKVTVRQGRVVYE